MIDERGFHYVLVNQKSSKHVSGKNHGHLAIRVKASELEADGHGGGIVSLLTANTPQQTATLRRIRATSRIDLVRIRVGKPNCLPHRQEVREALHENGLMSELISHFMTAIAEHRGPHYKSAKAVASWLQSQIGTKSSPVYALLARQAPGLLETGRGHRWWREQISQYQKVQS